MSTDFKFEKMLRNDQWQKIDFTLLEIIENNYHQNTTRLFIDAVLWVTVNNTVWTNLPEKYGVQKTKYMRFLRWTNEKIWYSLAWRLVDDEELGPLLGRIVERCDLYAKDKKKRNLRNAEKQLITVTPVKNSLYSVITHHKSKFDRSR